MGTSKLGPGVDDPRRCSGSGWLGSYLKTSRSIGSCLEAFLNGTRHAEDFQNHHQNHFYRQLYDYHHQNNYHRSNHCCSHQVLCHRPNPHQWGLGRASTPLYHQYLTASSSGTVSPFHRAKYPLSTLDWKQQRWSRQISGSRGPIKSPNGHIGSVRSRTRAHGGHGRVPRAVSLRRQFCGTASCSSHQQSCQAAQDVGRPSGAVPQGSGIPSWQYHIGCRWAVCE